jgi:hypothetical protein
MTVTVEAVRMKAGLDGDAYEDEITALLDAFLPALAYAVRPEHHADPDAGLQATLDLAATEIVAGELLAQIWREPGAAEDIRLGDLRLTPLVRDLADPFGLIRRGWERLRPYLKLPPPLSQMSQVRTATKEAQR